MMARQKNEILSSYKRRIDRRLAQALLCTAWIVNKKKDNPRIAHLLAQHLSKVILGKRLTGHDRIYSKAMANESNGET
jgi:hypothetical protein